MLSTWLFQHPEQHYVFYDAKKLEKKWLRTGINFSFSNTFQKLTVSNRSLIQVALRSTPDVPVRNADGSFAASNEPFMPTNPIAMVLLIDNHDETYGIRGNTYAEFTPGGVVEGLKLKTELSFNYNTSNGFRFQPTYRLSQSQFSDINEGRFTKQYNKYWGWTNTLTYDRNIDEVHKFTVLLGEEIQKKDFCVSGCFALSLWTNLNRHFKIVR